MLGASANTAVGSNRTWHRNLHEPLVELGHDVVLFPAEEGQRAMLRNDPRGRAAFSQKLLDTFRAQHAGRPFDLFFAYLMDGMVEPGAIDEIRKSGVPACNFSCNNTHQFDLVDELSPHFDYNLHSEKDARGKFLAIGAHPLWWPMASNPNYFKPVDTPRNIEVSFVGANYALRARYVAHLLEHRVDAHAYGPGWQYGGRTAARSAARRWLYLTQAVLALAPASQKRASALLGEHDFRRYLGARFPGNVHAPVSDDELIALYSSSHISLGFVEVHDRHDPSRAVLRHMHLREFEAPMCGALYCTGHCDELAEFFEPGSEVLVYHSEEELLSEVRFYLRHESEAEAVRQAGRRRALRDHTYQRRFETLFEQMGVS